MGFGPFSIKGLGKGDGFCRGHYKVIVIPIRGQAARLMQFFFCNFDYSIFKGTFLSHGSLLCFNGVDRYDYSRSTQGSLVPVSVRKF